MVSLAQVKRRAASTFQAGDVELAQSLYCSALAVAPEDFESRIGVADCLLAMGHYEAAVTLYRKVGWYCIMAGYPFASVVLARVIEKHHEQGTDLLRGVAIHYAVESDFISEANATRVGLPSPAIEVPDAAVSVTGSDNSPKDWQEVARLAMECADNLIMPKQVHPCPLLSLLPEALLVRLLPLFEVARLPDSHRFIEQGTQGNSLFFVASGEVSVEQTSVGKTIELAKVGSGAVLGEMAMVSDAPRSASAKVLTQADILELSKESLSVLKEEAQIVNKALSQFTQQRVLQNVLNHSPLFKPFEPEQRQQLLARFTKHDVEAGDQIISEGEEGQGLFVIVDGKCSVMKERGDDDAPLAVLGPGQIFGEMSLMKNSFTSANVFAETPAVVLFLAKSVVDRIVVALPEVREYLQNLAEDRALSAKLSLVSPEEGADDVIILI